MKLVYQFRFYLDKDAFIKIMEIVKCAGEVVKENVNNDSNDYIYIEYQGDLYKFNRYDKCFITKVEEARELNPYKNFPSDGDWGHLHIFEIDDRFSNKKYYKIKTIKKYQEQIEILHEQIIQDLYDGSLLKYKL